MIYLAAILVIAAVALFVAAPLMMSSSASATRGFEPSASERLEHEQSLALAALRDLEFDHEMGKLSEGDYVSLRATLERRALAAMSGLEQVAVAETTAGAAARRRPVAVPGRPRPSGGPSDAARMPGLAGGRRVAADRRAFKYCPQCGSAVLMDGAKFCAECRLELAIGGPSSGAAGAQR